MLDTNICVYLLAGHDAEKRATIMSRQPDEELLLSAIVVAELRFGVANSEWRKANHEQLDNFLRDFRILAFDAAAAAAYGDLRVVLQKKGRPIGPLDTLIAAHALSEDTTLVTHNTKEFSRVPGLKLADWTKPL
jgi:tRNA(fMet)-specific endonuclease VapC